MQYEQRQLQPTRDLHPAPGTRARACRQVAGEALELEVALRGERVAREELRELVDLAGAERDVDERELAEHLLLDRLRPAAADADDALRVAPLERLASCRWATKRSSAFSRIEQVLKRIRSASRALGGLAVAERLEHALHALGVVLVHLAPERGDVVALHGPGGYSGRGGTNPGIEGGWRGRESPGAATYGMRTQQPHHPAGGARRAAVRRRRAGSNLRRWGSNGAIQRRVAAGRLHRLYRGGAAAGTPSSAATAPTSPRCWRAARRPS